MKLTYKDDDHAYWLNGRRCKGVTSIASIPDNKYAIEQWSKRSVALGMALEPALVERAAAHFDDRDQMDKIAEEALVVAKTHQAAGRGTAIHRVTERIDLGGVVVQTPLAQAVQISWTRALDDAGLDIEPGFVERIVVYPDRYVCGTFDRLARRRTDGRLVVVDLKTGSNAVRYPHSIAIQMALYANAPLLAGPLPKAGGTTTQFEPLPGDLDRDWGVIIHMPAEDKAEAVSINIAAGWDAAQQIIWPALTWRDRKDLIQLQVPTVIDPEKAYLDLLDRTEWVRGRVDAIKAAGHAALLAAEWSRYPNVPTFPRGGPTNQAQIDVIAQICETIETQVGLPFGESDPTIPKPTKRKITA